MSMYCVPPSLWIVLQLHRFQLLGMQVWVPRHHRKVVECTGRSKCHNFRRVFPAVPCSPPSQKQNNKASAAARSRSNSDPISSCRCKVVSYVMHLQPSDVTISHCWDIYYRIETIADMKCLKSQRFSLKYHMGDKLC